MLVARICPQRIFILKSVVIYTLEDIKTTVVKSRVQTGAIPEMVAAIKTHKSSQVKSSRVQKVLWHLFIVKVGIMLLSILGTRKDDLEIQIPFLRALLPYDGLKNYHRI